MSETTKFLYETSINKLVDKPSITKTKDESGAEIEIKRVYKKFEPVKIAILKPDRKLFRAAELFYAKSLADYLKAGLLPYSLVAKRYANDGGPLSEEDKKRISDLKEQAVRLEQEFFTATTKQDVQSDNSEILVKINKINAELGQIQSAYSDIYESTAEMKARNDTLEWWSLNLSYINEGNGYKPLFGDGGYDDKINTLDNYDNNDNVFYQEVIKRLSFLIGFWFTARNTQPTAKDFTSVEKLYLETSNSYNPVEDKEPTPLITEKSSTPDVQT